MNSLNEKNASSFYFKGTNELFDRIQKPILGLDNTFEKLNLDSMKTASMKAAALSVNAMQNRISESLLGLNSTFEKLNLDSMKAAMLSVNALQSRIADSLLGLNNTFEKLNSDSMRAVALSISGLKNNVGNILFDQMVSLQENTLSYLDKLHIHIEPDGTIVTSEDRLNTSEIQKEVDSCLENIGLISKEIEIEKRIASFFSRIGERHPIIRFIILYFMISFFVNIYSSHFTTSPTNNYQFIQNKNVYIKVIQAQPQKMGIQCDNIKKYRFVHADYLLVREGNTTKAKVIGKIYFGQLVEIVYKNKNWTFIRWEDREEDVHEGWVFTRYLKRFR